MNTILFALTIFLLGTMYSFLFEYVVHRYVLHNRKLFKSAFKNHFKRHHGRSRKNDMYDVGYERLISSYFEVISLTLIAILHTPIIFVSGFLYSVILMNLIHYYVIHKKSHIDTEWGKKNLPWHYEHHMGKDQNINWGVRSPIIDKLVGTSKY